MRAQTRATVTGLVRAVEQLHQPARVLAVAVAAHAWLIDTDLLGTSRDQGLDLRAHDRQQCLGNGMAVGILPVRQQPAAECERPRHTHLEPATAAAGQPAQSLEFGDRPQAAWCRQFARDLVPATLVMGGRAKAPRARRLQGNPLEKAVERQVEIEPRLLAVGDDIQAGGQLILNRHHGGVLLHLFEVVSTKGLELAGREFQPARKGVAANDRGAQGLGVHDWRLSAAAARGQTRGAYCNPRSGKHQWPFRFDSLRLPFTVAA